MKKTKGIFALLLSMVICGLTGCGGEKEEVISRTPDDLNTAQTDKTKLQRSFEGKDFVNDSIGEVTFRSCTDGDTANFLSHGQKIKVRFLGVNTPESTAKVEPWGVAASSYVCSIISDTTVRIVIENDVDVFGKTDNNGTRHLGFVWYKRTTDADFRLLNLELVDLAYSINQLFLDSELCPYYEAFNAAEKYARTTGAKVYGQEDPMYDYSKSVTTISIGELRKNYDNYGKTDTSAGKQLRMQALVVGIIGDNMVLRDLVRDVEADEDSMLPGIYAYAGYNTALASVIDIGDVVFFYCRATKFNGVIQLSDLKTSMVSRDYPFKVLTPEPLTGPTTEYPLVDLSPYEMDTSSFTAYSDFEEYAGKYVETTVTVRNVNLTDTDEDGTQVETGTVTHVNVDANNNYTCYANSEGKLNGGENSLTLNLRVDGSSSPYIATSTFIVGHTYKVKGYLSPYFDKYQLMLFNNIAGMDYVQDVTPL